MKAFVLMIALACVVAASGCSAGVGVHPYNQPVYNAPPAVNSTVPQPAPQQTPVAHPAAY